MKNRLWRSKIIMVKDIRDRRSKRLDCLVKSTAIGYYGMQRGNEAEKGDTFFLSVSSISLY